MSSIPSPIDAAAVEVFQTKGYVYAAILTAFIWDWVLCTSEEVEILRETGVKLPIVVYYISRLASLGYCISQVLGEIIDPTYCSRISQAKLGAWWVAGPATSLLFFFRIRAVYSNSISITIICAIFWLAMVLSPIAAVYDMPQPDFIPNIQNHCDSFPPLVSVSAIITLCNDTFVFIGISCRMVSANMAGNNWNARWRSFIHGEGLYKLSKSILQGGQLYYGLNIGMLLATSVTVFFNLAYGSIIGPAYIALSCAMACRVFRMVRLCNSDEYGLSTADIEEAFRVASGARHDIYI